MNIQLTRAKRWLILLNVSTSVFMATLDGSIVNIALPVISKKLSVDISSIQWVVTAYLLTISILLLIWGKISDQYGRKNVFAAGFIIFTAGSALCSLSTSLSMLVFSRMIQAIGASSMMALSQGIITATFPPKERGKALGIVGTTVAIGSLVGPGLGGVLVHSIGWQSIFYINIPIGIIGTVLTFLIIPKLHQIPEKVDFDYKGTAMFVVLISLLFLGLLMFQESRISIVPLIVMLLVSAVLLALFIRHEKAAIHPLINLKLFNNSVFSLGIASGYLIFVAMFASILFLPFYLQYVLSLNTLAAGLLMSFYPIATAVVAPVSGWISDKISYRPLTIAGLVISTFSLFALSTLDAGSTHFKFAALMSLLGMGTALFHSPNTSSIMGSVPRDQLGIAGGINALFRNLGMISGITLSVNLFSLFTRMNINSISNNSAPLDTSLFLKGFKIVMTSAAITCLLAAVISIVRVRHNKSASI